MADYEVIGSNPIKDYEVIGSNPNTPSLLSKINPTDIASGMFIPKMGDILRSNIQKTVKEGLSPVTTPLLNKLPNTSLIKNNVIPKSIFDLGFKMGGNVTPKQLGETGLDIATDVGTYLPMGATKEGQNLLEQGGKALLSPTKVLKPLRLIPKVGGDISRKIADIETKSIKWIKERGSSAVFDPLKEQPDYVQRYLAPDLFKTYQAKTVDAMRQEGKIMSKALNSIKSDFVNLPTTYGTIRNILKKYGLIQKTGELSTDIGTREIPPAIKMIGDMYKQTAEGLSYAKAGEVTMPKGFFNLYRQSLRNIQRGAGSFSGDVQQVINSLYNDIEKAGAKGITQAKELYKQASSLEEQFGFNLDNFSTKLQSATNIKNFQRIKESLRPIYGKNTDEIFNKIKDHMVAQEFKAGNAYTSKPGIIRALSRPVMKGYYENIYPQVKKIQTIFK